ncbi:MAG: hypothetical protein R2755_33965 [Acidimicrobiales bacterium]
MLHPGRINDAVRGVHAELELLREQFLERLQPLAHRRELDVARQRLADAAETIDSQRQQLAALEARAPPPTNAGWCSSWSNSSAWAAPWSHRRRRRSVLRRCAAGCSTG